MSAEKITIEDGQLNVPNNPIIPFIEGDGTGVDIWPAAKKVLDAAVEKAYNGAKQIEWKEVLAGEKAFNATGEWMPKETLQAFREHLVGIKGPLTTPVGGGISDDGKTWEHFRNVADTAGDAFAYPSVTFVGDRALLTYFNYQGGISLFLQGIPVKWFYD